MPNIDTILEPNGIDIDAKPEEQKPLVAEEVGLVLANWEEVNNYHALNINNSLENWRFYWAKNPELGFGQWPQNVVAQMTQQQRQLLTYNLVKPTVDRIAGGIIQLPFDPEYYPVDSDITSLTKILKSMMYSDKELMDWKGTTLELLIHGLISSASIKMIISREYSPLGNIGFENCLAGSVLPDPSWKSWRSKDCKKCWKESWFTATELAEMYPDAGDEILAASMREKLGGDKFGYSTGVTPYLTREDTSGNKHRVIEEYFVRTIKKKCEYIITAQGEVEIPEMPDEKKPDWLNRNIPDWNSEMIYEKTTPKKVSYVKAVCKDLLPTRLLESGKTQVQCGRLPFFFWSASRANGENHSIVDSLKDAQMNVNYWESLLTYKIQIEGGGGAQFASPDMFETMEDFNNYCNNRNNPAATFKVKAEYMEKGVTPAKPIMQSQFPRELYENINHILQTIWPEISKVPPSTKGMMEGSQQSGKLYDLMRIQADMALYTVHYGYRLFWNDVYEAYLEQASELYSNEGVERQFNYAGEVIKVNEIVKTETGEMGIKNDISQLKNIRHKIIISETQESPTERMANVMALSQVIQSMPQGKPLTMGYLTNAIIKNLDQLGVEDKQMLEVMGMKELELAMSGIEMQIIQNKITTAKLQMEAQQIAMMTAQQQQGILPPPEGQVVEPDTNQQPAGTAAPHGGDLSAMAESITKGQPQVGEGV